MRIILGKGQILGPISGADETLITYATQLQKAGHTVVVLLMYLHSTEDQYYQRLVEAGVTVSWIASNLAHTSLATGRKVAYKLFRAFPFSQRLIRKNAQRIVTRMATSYYQQCRNFLEQQRADLLHVITPDPSAMVMICAGHDAGLPVIYQELGTPYHPPEFESYYEQFTSVLPLCTQITALSPGLVEMCREKLPYSNSLSVMPIISHELTNGYKSQEQHRRPDDKVVFGFAARIENLKGPMLLMEAFGAANRRASNIRLKVAGDGSLREQLTKRAESLDVAQAYDYYGVYIHPEERSAFMQSLDVFVLPSYTEGTPHVIVEAMAHGKPIIATRVGGIPDMLDAESGILIDPGDTTALTEAMLRLAQDPELCARMGKAARARCQQLFSPQAILPLILETYCAAVSRNREQISTTISHLQPSHTCATVSRINL